MIHCCFNIVSLLFQCFTIVSLSLSFNPKTLQRAREDDSPHDGIGEAYSRGKHWGRILWRRRKEDGRSSPNPLSAPRHPPRHQVSMPEILSKDSTPLTHGGRQHTRVALLPPATLGTMCNGGDPNAGAEGLPPAYTLPTIIGGTAQSTHPPYPTRPPTGGSKARLTAMVSRETEGVASALPFHCHPWVEGWSDSIWVTAFRRAY